MWSVWTMGLWSAPSEADLLLGAVAASLLLGESNPKRFAAAACATMIYEQKLQRWVMVVAQQPEMQSVASCQRLQPRAA